MSEREACPVCAVVHPGTCRNQRGQKGVAAPCSPCCCRHPHTRQPEGDTVSLHPDFPPTIRTGQYPSLPDPLDDLDTALATAGSVVTLDDLASVTEYDITSDAGKWEPGGSVATELSMSIVGTLNDGRWFALEAGNDYTGWGCQDFADIYVGPTREDVIANGLTTEGRNALGLAALAPASAPDDAEGKA